MEQLIRSGTAKLGCLIWLLVAACSAAALSADAPAGSDVTVRDLLARDLVGLPAGEVRMLTVDYKGGAASLPHRHNAQVFVYVLHGAVRMQVKGSPEVLLREGDTFYEGPDDVHSVSANADATEPARLLVFIVKAKGAPVSTKVS